MDLPSLYAIGAFIQALGQNPGLEAELQELGTAAHVYVGTGLGNVAKLYDASIALDRAQRRWDRFWASPSATPPFARTSTAAATRRRRPAGAGRSRRRPRRSRRARGGGTPGSTTGPTARRSWRSTSRELAEIERHRRHRRASRAARSQRDRAEKPRRRQAPAEVGSARRRPGAVSAERGVEHPQHAGGADLDAGQASPGLAFAPVAACSTFGVALQARDGRDPARRGQGGGGRRHRSAAAPARRRRLLQRARALRRRPRVAAADRLRGTHVAGGVGGLDPRRLRLHDGAAASRRSGMEPIAVGVSSDADHIITPTLERTDRRHRAGARRRRRRRPATSAPGTCTPPRRPATTTR